MEIKLSKVCSAFWKRTLLMIMRTFVFLLCTTVFGFTTEVSFSQEKVTIDEDKLVTVDQVFEIIKQQTDYKFMYPKSLFKDASKVQLKKGTIRVDKLLNQSISLSKFNIVLSTDDVIVIKAKSKSQQKQVSGKVTDETGQPLAGVTVLVKGTNSGTATDFDGTYTIEVVDAANVLVFSSIGFETQEISVGNLTVINMTLKESVSELDAVTINAGYYKTSKREATGSISKVKSKAIEQQPVTNPLAALQGRMSGVNITQSTGIPGGGFNIQIRGRNSIRPDGNEPLFIIDGIPFSNETMGEVGISASILPIVTSPGGNVKTGSASILNSINPADIESIEILKDADATAIYGSKGANGVVLITTKKGKAGKTKFDVKVSSGMSNLARTIDLMNTEEYLEMRYEAFANDGFPDITVLPSFYVADLTDYDQNRYTDWQDIFNGDTAYSNDIQTSVSGGSENTQFLFSAGYHKETTVTIGDDDYQKLSGMMNLNHQSENKKFKASLSTKYVVDKNNLANRSFRIYEPPNAPALYDENGDINWEWNNPIANLEYRYSSKTNSLINNALLEFELAPKLWLTTNLGFSRFDMAEMGTSPSTVFNPVWGLGSEFASTTFNNSTREIWNIEPQINWEVKLGKGKLSLLLGTTFREEKNESIFQFAQGFPNDNMISNIAAASDVFILGNRDTEYRYNAVFGRINYNLDGKYIVNVTGRRDGSTRFGPGKQFANFGAVGAAWIFSKENIFKENSILSYGKLRGSYGTTGSDQYGDYEYLDTYTVDSNNYDGVTGLSPTQLFNSNLAWEVNKKLEFGIELGFLKDRILLSTNYYRNRSSNQLIEFPLSGATGFTSITSNFDATVQNKGIEIELNTINIQKEELNWTTGFNITIPRNKLVSFPNLEESAAYKNRLIVGEPVNIIKTYEFTGVDPQTGLYTVKDINNDGDISFVDDAKIIISLDPKFYGGLSNNITYKNFELDFLFQFVKQEGRNFNGFLAGGTSNVPREYLDRWQQPGDVTSFQRYTSGLNPEANAAISDYTNSNALYSDASYIRLKNVSLSYSLPEKWTKGFKSRLYLQGQNLWTITNYFGLDPETHSNSYLGPLKNITFGAQFIF